MSDNCSKIKEKIQITSKCPICIMLRKSAAALLWKTLIVAESPKIVAKGNPWSLDMTSKVEPAEAQSFVKSILSSFFKMGKADQ